MSIYIQLSSFLGYLEFKIYFTYNVNYFYFFMLTLILMLYTCFMLSSISLSYLRLRVILLGKPSQHRKVGDTKTCFWFQANQKKSGLESRTFDLSSKSRSRRLKNIPRPNLLVDNLYSTRQCQYFTSIDQVAWYRVNQFMLGHQSNLEVCQDTQYASCCRSFLSLSYHHMPCYHLCKQLYSNRKRRINLWVA